MMLSSVVVQKRVLEYGYGHYVTKLSKNKSKYTVIFVSHSTVVQCI